MTINEWILIAIFSVLLLVVCGVTKVRAYEIEVEYFDNKNETSTLSLCNEEFNECTQIVIPDEEIASDKVIQWGYDRIKEMNN